MRILLAVTIALLVGLLFSTDNAQAADPVCSIYISYASYDPVSNGQYGVFQSSQQLNNGYTYRISVFSLDDDAVVGIECPGYTWSDTLTSNYSGVFQPSCSGPGMTIYALNNTGTDQDFLASMSLDVSDYSCDPYVSEGVLAFASATIPALPGSEDPPAQESGLPLVSIDLYDVLGYASMFVNLLMPVIAIIIGVLIGLLLAGKIKEAFKFR